MSSKVVHGSLIPKSTVLEWHVQNFTANFKKGACLYSPVFSSCKFKPIEWQLKLYSTGRLNVDKDFMSLFICYLGTEEITVSVDLSLINSDNVLTNIIKGEEVKCGGDSYPRGYSRFIRRSYVMDKKNKLLPDDTLKVLCEITFIPRATHTKSENVNVELFQDASLPEYRLKSFEDYESLLEGGNFSDVIFKVGEEKIKAHKAIITSRSSVFSAMFEHDMSEKEKSEIEIVDIKPEVMKELLRFLYASKVKDMDEVACDLLQAAEKYGIVELKTLCEESLCETLKVVNALQYLTVVDMNNCPILKSEIMKFIVKNQKDIVDHEAFQCFVKAQPELLCEVIRAMASGNSAKPDF